MPVNYADSKLYRVINSVNNIEYLGSTAQKWLSSRFCDHRTLSADPKRTSLLYTAMREIGADKFKIVLLKAFPCASKDALRAAEYTVIAEYQRLGKPLYNMRTQGEKHAEESKKKMSVAQKAIAKTGKDSPHFHFGSLSLSKRPSGDAWRFQWTADGTSSSRSFSVNKYGNYGALFRAEEARRQIYPEWRNDEDKAIDALMAIELD